MQQKMIMKDSKTLFWSSKFPCACERIYSKFMEIEHAPSKMFSSPCLVTTLNYHPLQELL